MFGVIISAVIALVVAICTFVLATFVGATLFRGEAGYGFALICAPLGAVVGGASAFVIAIRKLNFPRN